MLRPQPVGSVPAEAARIARAAISDGHPYFSAAEATGAAVQRFSDSPFEEAYPPLGQPALSPWRLALVTILQFAEGLSDRRAADAARARINRKYVLRLELTDPGYDASVLCDFCGRGPDAHGSTDVSKMPCTGGIRGEMLDCKKFVPSTSTASR